MTGSELSLVLTARLRRAMVTANLAGAVVVFVFLYYLLPFHTHPAHDQRPANAAAFVVYLVMSLVVGSVWGTRIAAPIREWLASERPAEDLVRQRVLRQPLVQTRVNATLWSGAVLLFGGLNMAYDPHAVVDIVVTIALGGLTTCGIAYLLCERCLRPAVSRAMADASAPPPVLLGLRARLLLAWLLGSGIPMIGILLGLWAPVSSHPPLSRGGVAFLACVGLAAGLLAIGAAAGAVSDPVRSVATALRSVGDGRLDVSVPVYDASEVGRLQSGFNTMVTGLRERDRLRDLFGRQVGDEVATRALEHGVELGGELREVAVLFVDVVGSTALAQSLPAQEVVRQLNDFFSVVVDVVGQHGGWVNKFEGDAALCVFGAPAARPDPRTDSLRAARSLAVALRRLSVDAAIGVAAGSVVAGNIGAQSRFEYTVIGDAVNVAARLTELAKESERGVLSDADMLASVTPDEAARWSVMQTVVLRGRSDATRVAKPI